MAINKMNNYEKKVLTVMINNFANINKTNLSQQIIEIWIGNKNVAV